MLPRLHACTAPPAFHISRPCAWSPPSALHTSMPPRLRVSGSQCVRYLRIAAPAALILLCPYFSAHLPCCAGIILRTYPAVPYFSTHFPCCALIFILLRTYPAVSLFFYALLR